jgi:hypothetical protein
MTPPETQETASRRGLDITAWLTSDRDTEVPETKGLFEQPFKSPRTTLHKNNDQTQDPVSLLDGNDILYVSLRKAADDAGFYTVGHVSIRLLKTRISKHLQSNGKEN